MTELKLATLVLDGAEVAALAVGDRWVPIPDVNRILHTHFSAQVLGLLSDDQLPSLEQGLLGASEGEIDRLKDAGISLSSATFAPLYRRPRKIWGIGLNYREHANDLAAAHPTDEPASFMKADTTIIGPGESILLPIQSDRVTAEAELGIVIGRECRQVSEAQALDYVAGYTPVLDMTAEDILQKNPRFLTRAKNFDTFFSFGPELLTANEIADLHALQVSTVLNDSRQRTNAVSNMTFSPEFLVSFHSQVMTLLPGDIISSGTPGAVVIRDGDIAECQIEGFQHLRNPVRRRGGAL